MLIFGISDQTFTYFKVTRTQLHTFFYGNVKKKLHLWDLHFGKNLSRLYKEITEQ